VEQLWAFHALFERFLLMRMQTAAEGTADTGQRHPGHLACACIWPRSIDEAAAKLVLSPERPRQLLPVTLWDCLAARNSCVRPRMSGKVIP
jgi:hypothetical protein